MYNDGPTSAKVEAKEPVIREILDRTLEIMGVAMKELSDAEDKLYMPRVSKECCTGGSPAPEDNSLESKAWKLQRVAEYIRDKACDINIRI